MARRWWLLALLACLLVLLGGAWGWRDVNRARAQLQGARETLTQVIDDPTSLQSAGGRASARSRVNGAIAQVDHAYHELRTSVPLSAAAALPMLRTQRRGALELVHDARVAARAGASLLTTADRLASSTKVEAGAIPLDGLRQLETAVRQTGSTLRPLARPASGLWGSLGAGRRAFDASARNAASRLLAGADAIGAARTFMGEAGQRRYFVAAENNAEMRDQGMILSYAIVRFSDGRFSFERQGSVVPIALHGPAPIDVPPGTSVLFGDQGPNQLWQAVNATADFAWTGRAVQAMYKQATGDSVDGVIAIDVPGIAAMLKAVGPVGVDGIPEPISSGNVSRILLHDLYEQDPAGDQSQRHERLAEVAAATIARLTSGSHDAVAIGRELGAAAAGGHVKLWSADTSEERTFERNGIGGGPAVKQRDRTFHVAVQNSTATKLDYYVKPKVRMEVLLTRLNTAVVRTTVTIANTAPSGQAPSYQLGPTTGSHDKPGDYVTRTQVWSPAGSTALDSVVESGLNVNQRTLRVGPGGQVTAVFETIIPGAVRNGTLDLRLVPQPRLDPMPLEIDLEVVGWHITGPLRVQRSWDRTFTVSWQLRH